MKKENLIIGNEYLVKSKSFGIRKVKFIEFEFIKPLKKEFAKFSGFDLVWFIPVEEIEEKVNKIVEVL